MQQRQQAQEIIGRFSDIGFEQLGGRDSRRIHSLIELLGDDVSNVLIYIGYLNATNMNAAVKMLELVTTAISHNYIDILKLIAEDGKKVIQMLTGGATAASAVKQLENPDFNKYTSPSSTQASVQQSQPTPIQYPSQSNLIKDSVLRSSRHNTTLAQQYQEKVGGPIWQRIVKEEKDYLSKVMDPNRQQERPDLNNPVGGLIDITDHIPGILFFFEQSDKSNWLIGKGVSNKIEMDPIPEYNLPVLQQLITGGTPQLAVAGGFPLHLATRTRCHDIDLFIVIPGAANNPQPAEWANLVKNYTMKALRMKTMNDDMDGVLIISDYSVTIQGAIQGDREKTGGVPSTVQVILRVYHSLTEVLTGFDIGACGVGLYNGRLYATERALYEIVNRTVMVSMKRASTSYPYRLIKYALKGFGLYVEGVESFIPISVQYARKNIPSLLEAIDLYVRHNGWISTEVTTRYGTGRADVRIKLPIGMTSDYARRDNTDARDVLDYATWSGNHNADDPMITDIDKVQFIYKNPFRQGSLSFHPVEMSLREWAGRTAVLTMTPSERLLNRIVDNVEKNLLQVLDDHFDWADLNDEQLMNQFEALFSVGASMPNRVALSLVRLHRLR